MAGILQENEPLPPKQNWLVTEMPVRSPTARDVSGATLWTVHDPLTVRSALRS
ncbi:hypothetical protein [Arthrobacter sp. CAN_C5]|uniref:hypothetical protein n=1 Tax=Arthrobacter sp. CAN_C5 TaxID=2760706 RepID=UPI001AEA2270|nr:hypothetical protein [Arthrobacter sp. CAN_C5]